jgi:putative DNA primase/helicase
MIEGCLEWQRDGLAPPAAVAQATEAYLTAEDTLTQWLDECCETGPNMTASAVAVWVSFKSWTEHANEFVGTQN